MPSGMTSRPAAGLTALATAAAVVAVVTVLTSGAVAGQRFATRDSGSDGPTTPAAQTTGTPTIAYPTIDKPTSSVFENGQLVTGDAKRNAYFEVPADWDYLDTMLIGLETKDSYRGLLPRVFGAAYYDADWCGTDDLPVGRAYFGLTGPVGTDDVRAANLKARDSWVAGLSFDQKLGDKPPTTTSPRALTLDDGTTAYVSSVSGRMTDGECASDLVKVTVLSIDTGEYVATVVGHRFLGTGKDLSEAMLMKVLTSVRVIEK